MAALSLALHEPDIPQNTGAILRLCACLDLTLHLIEPCGFILDDARLRRAGLDYIARARMTRHADFAAFLRALPPEARLVLLTTAGDARLGEFAFRPGDVLLFGRESSGAPHYVHDAAAIRLRIPMAPGQRSLNVAQAAAIAAFEALRSTAQLPG